VPANRAHSALTSRCERLVRPPPWRRQCRRAHGAAGGDDLDGGAGADTADYSGFFSANLLVGVVVDLHRGETTGDGADSLAEVENVKGSEFDDRIVGNLGPNVLLGSGGKDLIEVAVRPIA
jgi:Ca2+-binding RTX toxin-like protein